ncbi:MAG: 2-succinyl-5-enolpyruvyl-6-hydroxy-3-cyclohexene-1-carboxylic-acid synthase [Anaerolineae bacterium]|nr:2-succinyl-5-enolpyruvyl-6-hydroxy-3-cyclohexene-1-carboxylic-acid synthase [Anaerolineae bacterium]
MNAANRNLFWAKTFVDELARCGVKAVCIAPGSRSTPLVIAFAENPQIKVYSHIDERSAAFFALGLALASRTPVALLCSSGTATANFYPAIIEAHYSHVPLLVLTADRQHELRASGANQTIDQVKLYGDHVAWFYDVALPEATPPGVAIRNLRTLADRAYATARRGGVVHLNFPFRKPLEPILVESDQTDVEPYNAEQPFTTILEGSLYPSQAQIDTLQTIIGQSKRGLIICGQKSELPYPVLDALREKSGFVVLADILSNLRVSPAVISGYDSFLTGELPFEAPDLVIHFGTMPASAALEQYLNKITPRYRVLITSTGTWTDAYHRLTHVIHADPIKVCEAMIGFDYHTDQVWTELIQMVERITWERLQNDLTETFFDGSAIHTAIEAFNASDQPLAIFFASSLPVRHAEQYLPAHPRLDQIYSNRGASGIDGTISSAFGVAASHPEVHTVLVIGDLAFYHDLNGLLAAKRCQIHNLTIVLINNDGGGIFQRLPIAEFDPPFTDLFLTPHGLAFEPAIRMYGFDYIKADSHHDLQQAVKTALNTPQPTVIEVQTDSKRDLEDRLAIHQRVQMYLQSQQIKG